MGGLIRFAKRDTALGIVYYVQGISFFNEIFILFFIIIVM